MKASIYFKVVVCLFLTFSFVFKASANSNDPKETAIVEKANYPGGNAALISFITTNLQYPESARENGVEGEVVVSFKVDLTGKIQNVKIIKSLGYGCDQEVERVITLMPKWNPSKVNGYAVATNISMPIQFALTN